MVPANGSGNASPRDGGRYNVPSVTLQQIAERINGLFRQYGLDHDVVTVAAYVPPYGTVHIDPLHQHRLDPRENEPDPMEWRTLPEPIVTTVYEEIIIIDADDAEKMGLLFASLDHIFATFFDVHPPTDQLRLF